MSINQYASLQTLPVEILYYIFDCLDIQTILLSLHRTCRRLRTVVQNYDRYIIDFNLITKSNLRLICHSMIPSKVQSLTLSHSSESVHKIQLFNSSFPAKQFTRVHTLKLIGIKESQLRNIMKHVNIASLISLSIDIKEYNRNESSTATYLTSILIRSRLRKLILNISSDRIKDIRLFGGGTIEYLELDGRIDFEEINRILLSMPQLKTFIIGSCAMGNICRIGLVPFGQITVLALQNLNMKVDDLEFLLLLMPSLTHLKLIGNGNFLNGHRWEQFIRKNLLFLKKFEFFFTLHRPDQSILVYIERIIVLFRTTFWLQTKNWFVTCECNINSPQSIQLYSIPICASSLKTKFEPTKISMSTLVTEIDKDACIMVNIDRITFNFTKLTPNDIEQKILTEDKQEATSYPLFRTMKTLGLVFDSDRPLGWISFVSMFINLTTITHILLKGSVILNANSDILTDITSLFQQASNASILGICGSLSNQNSHLTADNICSMIPSHVKYLTVSIKDLNEVRIVLERLEHLSNARFIFHETQCWDDFHEWFETKKPKMSCQVERKPLYVWFKKNINVNSDEMKACNKRIKLTDDHHNS